MPVHETTRLQARLTPGGFVPNWPYIGVDEAGRGCLAGPVVAAAVLLPRELPEGAMEGLGDSKKILAERRVVLAGLIQGVALGWGLGVSWPAEIDRVNILNATFRSMSRAVISLWRRTAALNAADCPLVVDGPHSIRPEAWRAAFKAPSPSLPVQWPVVDGDALVPAVSAASILAKTWRDSLLVALSRRYPGYSLERHKGYGTREHLECLARLGPCAQHRQSFRPLRRDAEQLKFI